MIRITFLALVFALVASSCGSRKESQAVANTEVKEIIQEDLPEHPLIRYVRTPCFGTCPSFELVAYSTGRITYDGKNFVDNVGLFSGKWTPEEIGSVFAIAKEINYFELLNSYNNKLVMDLPSVTTELWDGSEMKSILNRYQGPEELRKLYEVLDNIIANTTWTPASE